MSTMAGHADRYFIFTGTARVRVPQADTTTTALLDAYAARHGALNLVIETGPTSKPTSTDIVRRYGGAPATRLVTVTDDDGNRWAVRPGDLIAA